jgi:hypothetical protein
MSILLAFVMLSGCATQGALRNARESFERSKAAGAEKKAPYEYFMAESYLNRAEHEAKENDGDAAREYAGQAEKYSADALDKATKGGK